jgi:hypothetical protein
VPDRSSLQVPAHAALPRAFLDVRRVRDRFAARLLVDVLAVRQLLLDHVDLADVLEPARQITQRMISAAPCNSSSAPASGIMNLKW